jgi:hypothetical protein
MSEPIQLGGRDFYPVRNSTIQYDLWMMKRIRACGLDRLQVMDDETPEDFALRLFNHAIESDSILELLAGMLLPEGIDSAHWTPTIAQENLAFISTLTNTEDKRVIQSQFASMLIGFFSSGIISAKISPKSLKPAMVPEVDSDASAAE